MPLLRSDPAKRVDSRYFKYLPKKRRNNGPTIAKICKQYLKWAPTYYRRADGTETPEVCNFKYALMPLKKLYGRTYVIDFGPLRLRRVQEEMIAMGWCRRHINGQIGRIKRVIKCDLPHE